MFYGLWKLDRLKLSTGKLENVRLCEYSDRTLACIVVKFVHFETKFIECNSSVFGRLCRVERLHDAGSVSCREMKVRW